MAKQNKATHQKRVWGTLLCGRDDLRFKTKLTIRKPASGWGVCVCVFFIKLLLGIFFYSFRLRLFDDDSLYFLLLAFVA